MEFARTLFLLFAGHFLADYPLQGDYMAKAKDPSTELGKHAWLVVLPGHAVIHAFFVYMVTQNLLLALIEVVIHSAVDFLKCKKCFSYYQDQMIHLGCKVVYAVIVTTLS